MEPIDDLTNAKKFCNDNLAECCREIVKWHETGILCEGKVRDLAHILTFNKYDSLRIAENLVSFSAMKKVAGII